MPAVGRNKREGNACGGHIYMLKWIRPWNDVCGQDKK